MSQLAARIVAAGISVFSPEGGLLDGQNALQQRLGFHPHLAMLQDVHLQLECRRDLDVLRTVGGFITGKGTMQGFLRLIPATLRDQNACEIVQSRDDAGMVLPECLLVDGDCPAVAGLRLNTVMRHIE